jgi:3-hydroxy-9,10-secoandrosta-1,3,5(10)-triene-9,17-dione monooxygenase reductase component
MTAEFAETVLRRDPERIAPPTPLELRAALGLFASGVTIITGLDSGEAVGFACQSFASLSLDPPLVLFCADHTGRTWPRIRKTGRFTVNVLGEEQTDLCARFGSRDGRKFQGLDWVPSSWGTPGLPGVLLRIHADVVDVHVAGDHDVVIARVRELEHGAGGRPMVFFRGKFGLDAQCGDPDSFLPFGLWGWTD